MLAELGPRSCDGPGLRCGNSASPPQTRAPPGRPAAGPVSPPSGPRTVLATHEGSENICEGGENRRKARHLREIIMSNCITLKPREPNTVNLYVCTKPDAVSCSFIHHCQAGEQRKCPSGVNNLLHIHSRGCYPEIKRNELSHREKTRRSLECILVTERSQSEKATDAMIPMK